MFNKSFFLSRSLIIIFLISFILAFLKGSGLYGFGNDFYVIYHESNLNFGSLFNRLGWIISTFTINNFHLGVHITSFILTISFGFLLRSIFILKKLDNLYFFIFILIFGFHTWPIIMSTSNAMRQGLCMSMIFLGIAFYLDKKIFLSFIFFLISLFMHKSGPFIFVIFIFSHFVRIFMISQKKYNNLFFIFFGILIFSICLLLVYIFEDGERNSRIIFKDYRFHFIILSILYLVIFHYKNFSFKLNMMNLFVYYYFFGTLAVIVSTLNYEYERLQMMILIPLIFSYGLLFNIRSSYIYYVVTFSILLTLTIYNGMYESFY